MENFLAAATRKRFLICYGVDNASTARLSEVFVPLPMSVDAIIACGPFCDPALSETEEGEALRIADVASVVAQLENIVCRVLYLPSSRDPVRILTEECHLTPNSITLHGRRVKLTSNLIAMGFSEPEKTVEFEAPPMINEEDVEVDVDAYQVQAGQSIQALQDLLTLPSNTSSASTASAAEETTVPTSIFTLSYQYAHTLNHFLFHLSEELQRAGVSIAVITSLTSEEATRLPKKFGPLTIIAPGSLKNGDYCLLDLQLDSSSTTERWIVEKIEHCKLPASS